MEEYTTEKLGIAYITFADLMKLAKGVPLGSHPTYQWFGALVDAVERDVDLNVDSE